MIDRKKLHFLTTCIAVWFGMICSVYAQKMTIVSDVHHDVSPAVRDLPILTDNLVTVHPAPPVRTLPPRISPQPPFGVTDLFQQDPVQQNTVAVTPFSISPVASLGFDGIGQGQFGFAISLIPPDPNGAVGDTQYVQWVNASFAVFSKTDGAIISGPTAGSALWNGFGGPCQATNDGDPVVSYDKLANRWIFTQFSNSSGLHYQCIAVSTSSDATGTYNRYAVQFSVFIDYTKMGVWPDGYYFTTNLVDGSGNVTGSEACAFNRTAMLAGQPLTGVCFQRPSSDISLLPSDLDGVTPPPAGAPNFMINLGSNDLRLYRFHVDFANPAASTFTGPQTIATAAFSQLCGGNNECIPQFGTSNLLNSLGDRLMYRLAYRNLNTHESLVLNHSVAAGSSGGVRWYEIQNPSGSPILAQQSTYTPDPSFRWMGSIAMDKLGDIALGYSVSSSSMFPAVRYAAHAVSDPANTMESETTIINGNGSETSIGPPMPGRWGDYTAMQIDPIDDCTFWYTNEYLRTTGTSWNTRIANFRFPNCGRNTEHVFYLAADQHVHELDWDSTWSPNDITTLAGAPGAATGSTLTGITFLQPGNDTQHVFYLTSDGHVHELNWSGGTWLTNDITSIAGAPAAIGGSPMTSFTFTPRTGGNQEHVYFFTADGHVHELVWISGVWSTNDITILAGAPAAISGSRLTGHTFIPFGGANGMHVLYIAGDLHVHELNWSSGTWVTSDLTSAAGGVNAVATSSLDSFTFVDSTGFGSQHIFYLAADQHVHHLQWASGAWSSNDVTGLAGAPNAVSGTALAGFTFVPPGGVNGWHVFYFTSDGHVHELNFNGASFLTSDLTSAAGGPAAVSGSALTAITFLPPGGTPGQHIFYVSSDQHVHELDWTGGTWFAIDPTPAGAANALLNTPLTSFGFNVP
jgi:hypothetical protein